MDIIEEAKVFAKEIFAGDASGHGFDHTMRVFRIATRIAQEEHALPGLLTAAAWLTASISGMALGTGCMRCGRQIHAA